MKILFISLLCCSMCNGQQKKDNTITIKGVTFFEAVERLMDAGFTIEKSDSVFKTIRTDWKTGKGKTEWMKERYLIRIKDSTAFLTGHWYNTMFVGIPVFGRTDTPETAADQIEYTWGNNKACFRDMQDFALSFKKPVQYSINK